MPRRQIINNLFLSGRDADIYFSGIRIGGFTVNPEMRWYFLNSQTAPNGLYTGPFLRYQNYRLTGSAHYHDPKKNNFQDLDFRAGFTQIGAGVQAGYQVLIAERITLDFYLVGPWLGILTFKGKISGAKDLIPYEELEEYAQVFKLPFIPIDLTVTDESIEYKQNTVMFNWRAGISLGVAF